MNNHIIGHEWPLWFYWLFIFNFYVSFFYQLILWLIIYNPRKTQPTQEQDPWPSLEVPIILLL